MIPTRLYTTSCIRQPQQARYTPWGAWRPWLYAGLLLMWIGVAGLLPCQAQRDSSNTRTPKTDTTRRNILKRLLESRDSLRSDSAVNASLLYEKEFLDSLREQTRQDTSHRHLYQQLKKRFYKHALTRKLFDIFFLNPYSEPVAQTPASPKNPYRKLEGRRIGNVYIKRLDPFGPRVGDTLRLPANWLEKTGNVLHHQTREYVIRKTLLFRKGNTFVASMISDNERILRQSPYLLDARIYALPRPGRRDSVDILVVTQDVWSVNGGLGTNFSNQFDAMLTDNNFLGLGHSQTLGITYDTSPHPYTKTPKGWGFSSIYLVPFIAKTFVTGSLEYTNRWDRKRHAAMAYRNFLTPDMKYAGGAELSHNRIYAEKDPLIKDSPLFPVAYDYGSVWMGRSFRPAWVGDRTRIVIAARLVGNRYQQRPEVRPDTNQLYQHRWLNLYSVGFSTRNYLRDFMIYGFGRTEDVPYGSLYSITTGVERGELYTRQYAGFKAAHGKYYNRIGYALFSLSGGSFLRDGHWEQGTLSLEVNYFSRLMEIGASHVRQFMNVRYTHGLNRFPGEVIDINSYNGLRGINNAALRGEKSLVVNLETVCFTPLNLLGFQIAVFGYADLGWIGANPRFIFKNNFYGGYGIGIRVRNENLTFNTFQFRLGLYQNIPIANPLRTEFSEFPRTRLPDFDIGAPNVVPYGAVPFQ